MMTIKPILFALALAGTACTKASNANETPTNTSTNGQGAAPRAKATVTLTSVTFADDCGGTAPPAPPASPPAPPVRAKEAAQAPADVAVVGRRRCEQTSMQLAIGALADAEIHIKSVEVLDEAGKSLGTLTASKPTRWSDASSTYEAWDEQVAAKQTARVSYVLSQPGFVNRYDSHDRTYTVKVVASVGGIDQPLQTTVMVVAQPAPVPT